MSVNLQKGEKVSLTKNNPTLSNVIVGLGWDPVSQNNRGFLKTLLGQKEAEIDCDASVFLCDEQGRITQKSDIIYFGNLEHASKSVRHMGDNLTGSGQGDDEQIFIKLTDIPASCSSIVFLVNIYQCIQRKQHFGMITNAFIRLVNADTNQEICRYNLTEDYNGKTAMIMGELHRQNNDWDFQAMGQGTNDTSIADLAKRYSFQA